jgi:hypothetical protein
MNPEALTIRGIGVVTKYHPEDLAAKMEIQQDLIDHRHLEGAALEAEALRIAELYGAAPYSMSHSHNTLVNGGTNNFMLAIIGGTITGGGAYTNAVAALGVGDSAAGFSLAQTNLQGAVVTTDRVRKAMNATFPSVAAAVATFQSTFATTDANFQWNEWAVFNNVTDASGTMLNRAVTNLGTKTSAAAWQLTSTLTIS